MIKGVVKKALIGSGALRWLAHRRGKSAAILMYHSVLEEPSRVTDSLGGIVLSTRTFQSQIEMLARDFRPIDLEQAGRFVTEEGELPERAVVITFDDGYTDNYEIAMPILNRVGVPATFYVTVDCIERRTLPWPSRLRFASARRRKRAGSTARANRGTYRRPKTARRRISAHVIRSARWPGLRLKPRWLALKGNCKRSFPTAPLNS